MDNFMKPIIETYYSQLQTSFENEILKGVQRIGVQVDKERLLQALKDAKEFWHEGYEAGCKGKPRWISVEERLPEENGHYLVYEVLAFGGMVSMAFYTPKYNGLEPRLKDKAVWYKYDSEYGYFEVSCVTHWMPLPEPPEVEG